MNAVGPDRREQSQITTTRGSCPIWGFCCSECLCLRDRNRHADSLSSLPSDIIVPLTSCRFAVGRLLPQGDCPHCRCIRSPWQTGSEVVWLLQTTPLTLSPRGAKNPFIWPGINKQPLGMQQRIHFQLS